MKQRLTGTVVVGCLAIIFIPILLDGEGVSSPAMTGSMPAAPSMPSVPDTEPVRPDISSDTIPSNTLGQDAGDSGIAPESGNADTVQSPPPAPEAPTLGNDGLPATWSVRLGSFGEMANAEALVARLRDQGYKGFSRPITTSRGALTGVYVGPVLTEAEAGRMQQELAGAFELEGVVVQFSIDEPEQ